MEKYFKIKDSQTLELFIVSSNEQSENSVLVTDENSNFIKPKANNIVFTKVVEGITEEEIDFYNQEQIKIINQNQYDELQPYDWYFTRFIRKGIEVPKEIINITNDIDEKYKKLKEKYK